FFFSSRRRHTRSKRDWSSDVCSSDLALGRVGRPRWQPPHRRRSVPRGAGRERTIRLLRSPRSRRGPRMNASPGKIEIALFAVGLALAGLVLLALLWSGVGPYADMARANGADRTTFIDHTTGGHVEMELGPLVEEHRVWSTYVTGGTGDPPAPGRFYAA